MNLKGRIKVIPFLTKEGIKIVKDKKETWITQTTLEAIHELSTMLRQSGNHYDIVKINDMILNFILNERNKRW